MLQRSTSDTDLNPKPSRIPPPTHCDPLNSAKMATSQASNDIDDSWFHKACKEVIAPQMTRNNDARGSEPSDTTYTSGAVVKTTPDKHSIIFPGKELLWLGTPQVFAYYFMGGNDKQHSKVQSVIEEWTWYVNFVFKEARRPEESNIRIKFDEEDGNWSYIGRQCGHIADTDATMNIACLDKTADITSMERAVILHEFGHALGLLHEHQCPAHGGQAIRNIQRAIDLYSKRQGWSIQQVYDRVISVYASSDISNFSLVDVKSIMYCPQPKELTGLKEDIPYNQELSDLDKAYMILQYPRKEMHPKAAQNGWSFKKALDIMAVPEPIRTQVLRWFEADRDTITGEISPTNSRDIIMEWIRGTHLKPGFAASSAPIINLAYAMVPPSRDVNPDALLRPMMVKDGNGLTTTLCGDGMLADQNAAKNSAPQAITAIQDASQTRARDMPRMWRADSWADSLMQDYLSERKAWELKKDEMFREASSKASTNPTDMEQLTRTLARVITTEEARLASKFADATAHGSIRNVRGPMGHSDLKALSESLQDTTDSFGQSAPSSLYTSSQVRPATIQPMAIYQSQPLEAINAEVPFLEKEDNNKFKEADMVQPSYASNSDQSSSATEEKLNGIHNLDDQHLSSASELADTSGDLAGYGLPIMVQDSSNSPKTNLLADALQTALQDNDVSNWLSSQPKNTRDELWSKLQAAFGKVSE